MKSKHIFSILLVGILYAPSFVYAACPTTSLPANQAWCTKSDGTCAGAYNTTTQSCTNGQVVSNNPIDTSNIIYCGAGQCDKNTQVCQWKITGSVCVPISNDALCSPACTASQECVIGSDEVTLNYHCVEKAASPTPAPTPPPACPNGTCAITYTPLEPLPTGLAGGSSGQTDSNVGLVGFLNYLFPILITLGAMLGVGALTIHGVEYMIAGSPGKKSAAKDGAINAIWGILILVSSVLILNTINPKLTYFDLKSLATLGNMISPSSGGNNGASIPSQYTTGGAGSPPASGFPQ